MMNLRQMEVFHAIMVTGSVTSAARFLNVTQPAVSSVLKHCESQLKMKLFMRVAGRLQPTAEARAIFPDIAAIFNRLDAVGRLTEDLVGGRLGTISIAAAFPIANSYVAKAVASFVTERPNIHVALQSLSSLQVLDRVINREAEIGIAHDPVVNSVIETEIIARTRIVCVMRDDHPLAAQDEIAIRDLEPYPILTYLPQVLFRGYVDEAFSEAGIAPDIKVQFSVSLTGIILAQYGAGVALVEPILMHAMSWPNIVMRPVRPGIEVKTLMIRQKSVPLALAMQEFVQHLKATMKRESDISLPYR